MNLKTKWSLITVFQAAIPAPLLIGGPLVGMPSSSHHARIAQIFSGVLIVALLSLVNYFGYCSEERKKALFASIRTRMETIGAAHVTEDELKAIVGGHEIR